MQVVRTVGLDIAKSIFQVHGVDAAGQVVIRRQLKRRYVLAFFEKLPACLPGHRGLCLVAGLREAVRQTAEERCHGCATGEDTFCPAGVGRRVGQPHRSNKSNAIFAVTMCGLGSFLPNSSSLRPLLFQLARSASANFLILGHSFLSLIGVFAPLVRWCAGCALTSVTGISIAPGSMAGPVRTNT